MKLGPAFDRNRTNYIRWLMDEWLPPILRDSPLLMLPIMSLIFGKDAKLYKEFKEKSFQMTEAEYLSIYDSFNEVIINRPTDLNRECIEEILKHVVDGKVLEVGCGKGYLSSRIAKKLGRNGVIEATDLVQQTSDRLLKSENLKFSIENGESLSYPDASFDVVICTHTLEHVLDIQKAISELRRVCKKQLIIVVPKQRPYKYTFDLHLNFFPYTFSLVQILRPRGKYNCIELGGDLFYLEVI